MTKLIIYIVAGTCGLFAKAEVLSVHQLNQDLRHAHAGWTAKDTPISQLPREQAKLMMGLDRELSGEVTFAIPQSLGARANFPIRVDWRDHRGANWVSPVLDQGYCGSCVAFASVATMETQYKINSGFAGFNVKLSPQHMFACGGGACQFGWFPEAAARYLQRSGVPDEACMPYISGATGQDMSCSQACSDAPKRSLRLTSYTTPSRSAKDIDSVRQALQKGPLVTTLSVYEDFMYYAGGIYKHVSGGMMGGHAVSIIGYDDSERAFLIRNSWGKSWGEAGFGRVSYDDVSGIGNQTWSFDLPAFGGGVSLESPLDYAYVSSQMTVKARSTFSGTDSLSATFVDSKGNTVWTDTRPGNDFSSVVNLSSMSDGRYEAQVIAIDRMGKPLGTSARQFFYVVNRAPSLAIDFLGKNVDLRNPVKNIVEFRIVAQSSSAPMNRIEFHRIGPDGKEVIRTGDTVIDGMVMGWRTNAVPNGAYELWMVGHVITEGGLDIKIESPRRTVQVTN